MMKPTRLNRNDRPIAPVATTALNRPRSRPISNSMVKAASGISTAAT
ncbi:MAG: hypothetical protein WKF75_06480 [Singulisphaera sp.]